MFFGENNAEFDAAGNDADFAGSDIKNAEFCVKAKSAELGNDQQFAVGGVEEAILHRGVGGVEVDGDALLHGRIAVAAKRDDAIDEVGLLFGNGQRVPAQLIGRSRDLQKRPAANESCGNLFVGAMGDGGTDAIGPGAAIGGARRGKWRSAELLGVEAEGMHLRCVLALRQTSFDGFGGKFISKAGLVSGIHRPCVSPFTSSSSQAVLAGAVFGLVHCFVDLVKTGDCKQQLVQLIHLYRSREHLVQ